MPDAGAGEVGTVWWHLDEHDQRAVVVLDRPAKRGALTPEMLTALGEVCDQVAASEARAVVVRSSCAQVFCAGADINRFAELPGVRMWRDWAALGHRVFDTLAALRQPTIAVVHGSAFGGGFELVLACDFRVVATEAQLGLPEVGLGTIPGWGGTGRLTELVGPARAKEVVLARRFLDARTAHAWGLATAVAPAADLDKCVDELVAQLAGGAPIALQLAKQLIDSTTDGVSSRVTESLASGLSMTTDDLHEGVTAFRERRPPHFRGH